MSDKKIIKYLKFTIGTVIVLAIAFSVYSRTEGKTMAINKSTAANHIIESNDSLQDSIVNYGKQFLGTPYVAAGCSKDGFDCSGFVYFVFQHHNINVPRSSSEFKNFGKEIALEDVQKGDLLLFLSPTRNVIGHIGIVSKPNGKESEFIHASSGREMKVIITNLLNKGYTRRFVKAIRVL